MLEKEPRPYWGWERDVGIPTAIFVCLLTGPWCVLVPPMGFLFLIAALVIVPPIWWWLVRGRTDEPVRGAVAGLLIGLLVPVAEFLIGTSLTNGPMRGEGLGGLIWGFIGILHFVAAVASVVLCPLLGVGVVYLMRRIAPRGTS